VTARVDCRHWIVAFALTLAAGPLGGTQRADRQHVAAAAAQEAPWFSDVTAASGVSFTHFNGVSGEFYYPEIMLPGVALFDYDNDGDRDLFVVQGRMLGSQPIARAHFPPADVSSLGDRLFRNDLRVGAGGERTLHFTDVTDASGITARGYGMDVATGDFNNDGCIDPYVTNLGSNQLFRNNRNGTFIDVTGAGHTESPGWSISAAFVDFDRDGWLDLFVGHYVNYRVEANVKCFGLAGGPDYYPPQVYTAQRSSLFHNKHDGTFTDVTARAGMSTEFGPALGVWPDGRTETWSAVATGQYITIREGTGKS